MHSSRRFRLRVVKTTGLCLALGLVAAPAAAQLPPSSVAPGQLERRFIEPRLPESQPEPEMRPAPGPEAAPAAPQLRFTLLGLQIEGSTVYQAADLTPLYAEFLSREIGVAEVDEIARRITAKYRADGYILSRAMVPAQRVTSGILQIQIIEGFIDGTRIEGSFRGDPGNVHVVGPGVLDVNNETATSVDNSVGRSSNVLDPNAGTAPGSTAPAAMSPSSLAFAGGAADVFAYGFSLGIAPVDLNPAAGGDGQPGGQDSQSLPALGGGDASVAAYFADFWGYLTSRGE